MRRSVREALKIPEDYCVFLFVGRIARDKGVFDLVEAFSMLAAKRDDIALLVVGPDEEGVQLKLESAAGRAAEKIFWQGPSFEPERFMASADVLVLPSYREGFGLVIVEAGACAIPTIAYRIDGVVDAVIDGSTGVLLDVGDVSQLSASMEAMAARPAFRHELGMRARQRVLDEFSDTAVTSAWVAFYDEALTA